MPEVVSLPTLDQRRLDEVRALLDEVGRADGRPPLPEPKQAQLHAAGGDWSGVLAHDDARLVGYAHMRWAPVGAEPRVQAEVVVHPDHRGGELAERLADEVLRTLAGQGGGVLYLWARRVADPSATFAARLGMSVQRRLALMARRLEAAPAAPRLPEGLTLRAHRPGVDDAQLLRVNNAAFAGHPENGDWGPAELRRRRALTWFDPAGLLMAWRGDELTGFHWTKVTDDEEPTGEVYVLAVDPSARRLGLGRALLRAGLRHLYAQGCRRVVLYVDLADRPAVELYGTEGFTTRQVDVCYEQWVEPARASPGVGAPARSQGRPRDPGEASDCSL
ncbi:MAG: mycothiol synthase [Actinobacteria bacterium]|nr:mycothiol synthase [Actinomycetota bacterium]